MTANHEAPFVDLAAPHLELEEELTEVFTVNFECRPYELGWFLYAFAVR